MRRQTESLSKVTAVILAGGFGTRLKSIVADRPKGLVEINGCPFLSYLLDQLLSAGVERVVFCTGYMASQIEKEFGSSYDSLSLLYSEEKAPLGTAGALKNAERFFESEFILVMNGDSYCDLDIKTFWAWHCNKNSSGSLLLVKVPEANRYGCIQTGLNNQITEFKEKSEQHIDGWINAGIYLLQKELIKSIPGTCAVSLEREMFPIWLSNNSFFGYQYNGIFIDIGIPEDLEKAKTLLLTHDFRMNESNRHVK
jgi:NDP-sugar pyrophosphorylase family protein